MQYHFLFPVIVFAVVLTVIVTANKIKTYRSNEYESLRQYQKAKVKYKAICDDIDKVMNDLTTAVTMPYLLIPGNSVMEKVNEFKRDIDVILGGDRNPDDLKKVVDELDSYWTESKEKQRVQGLPNASKSEQKRAEKLVKMVSRDSIPRHKRARFRAELHSLIKRTNPVES